MIFERFSPSRHYPLADLRNHKKRAIATGEFRPPKKGELYLSGSHIEAFVAHDDLTTSYYIAVMAPIENSQLG